MSNSRPLLLASKSPRRREIFSHLEWDFEVGNTSVVEQLLPEESPKEFVTRIAEEKATNCVSNTSFEGIVVSADTIVVFEGGILGKPSSIEEAASILSALKGKKHQVLSCVIVADTYTKRLIRDLCITDVEMREYSDSEILDYVNTGDPMDKAGAYAIQYQDFAPVNCVHGCFLNVVGLPLCHLARSLNRLEFTNSVDYPEFCLEYYGFSCTISQAILSNAMDN